MKTIGLIGGMSWNHPLTCLLRAMPMPRTRFNEFEVL